jgi:uncharacterized protein YoxC
MKSKKGFSLSIETVVIMIIILVALIIIVMFITGTSNPLINTLKNTANSTSTLATPIGK